MFIAAAKTVSSAELGINPMLSSRIAATKISDFPGSGNIVVDVDGDVAVEVGVDIASMLMLVMMRLSILMLTLM